MHFRFQEKRDPSGYVVGLASNMQVCVAVCCNAMQRVATSCSVWQCVAVCCSVFQCVAVCCDPFSYVVGLASKCGCVLQGIVV